MDERQQAAEQDSEIRDGRGRFRPGHSGNPAGKPPGTKHYSSILARVLRDGEAEEIARKLIEKAAEGSQTTARWVMDRVEPRARGRLISLDLPPEATVADGARELLWRTLEGRISTDEALQFQRIIEHTPERPAAAGAPAAVDAAPAAAPTPAGKPVRAPRAVPPPAPPRPEFDLNFQAIAREAAATPPPPIVTLMPRPKAASLSDALLGGSAVAAALRIPA